jgi:hypothetical protein
MNAISPELDPIEIDPRPCELCGLTIDRHEMVDDGEGPVFFCTGEIDDAAQPEIAEPRDRRPEPQRRPEPYWPAESTVQAFWYVARNHDADYLARWLADQPADAPYLLKIWERKNARA